MKAFTSGNNLYIENLRDSEIERIKNHNGVWGVFKELDKNNIHKVLYTIDPSRLNDLVFKLNMPIKKIK